MKAKKTIAGLLCAALILFAGCGTTAETQSEAKSALQNVTVGEVAHSIFYAPGYAAMSLGYFEEEGLKVDLINLQGADKVMSALISDEIQVGLMGPEASVYVANQQLEDYAVNFAQLTQRDGSFLVGRE
ncbi:MAG: ABC transporter substrate-binding protein, partial [Peptococcaceae bacterium]|nr:ABC transporter substrate-binding protein [Peptococcaceae bacterium]